MNDYRKPDLFLESINIKRFFNFSDTSTSELNRFNIFNLFIGANGSGKSNVVRVLEKDFYQIGWKPAKNSYHPSFNAGYSNYNYDFLYSGYPHPDSEIEIQTSRRKYQYGQRFRNSDTEADTGAFFDLNKVCIYKSSSSINQFRENIYELFKDTDTSQQNLAFISFSIFYIFGLRLRFKDLKVYEELSDTENDIREKEIRNFNCLPSGVLSVFNLMSKIILNGSNRILCIDEPEIHLEPRIIRKLIHFIFYLVLKRSPFYKDFHLHKFEIIERQFIKENLLKTNYCGIGQVFFISHSPSVINTFIEYSDITSTYEFSIQKEIFNNENFLLKNPNNGKETSINVIHGKTITKIVYNSIIRKVEFDFKSILDSLGAKGSDLLQTNGIIWVEGPSDIIYIKNWLELYIREKGLPKYVNGFHYKFLPYGGALLNHYSYEEPKSEEVSDYLVNMFMINKNAFVVMDSDSIITEDGIIDKSNFKNAKDRLFDLSLKEKSLEIWYDRDNPKLRTIESFLDSNSKELILKSSLSKVKVAKKVVEKWENTKLNDFDSSLLQRIEKIYSTIEKWNTK